MFDKELLSRLYMEIPSIRPRVLSEKSFLLLDKIRTFRHFIRHAYDCELKEKELQDIQQKLTIGYPSLKKDFEEFKLFIKSLL